MNLFAITNLLCGTFCLLLGIFSLLAGKKRVYQLLALFNFTVCVWGFGTFAVSVSANTTEAVTAWRIAHSGGFFIGAFFYHLVCTLIGVQRKKIQILGYAQAVIFIILTCGTPWVLSETRIYHGFIYVIASPLHAVAVLFYICYVLMSFMELGRYLAKAEKGDKKNQIQCFFYGFFIGFLGGTSILLPEFYLDWVYPAGNMGVFIYAAIITYAVLKNRILDIQEIADAFQREKMAVLGTMAASLNHEIKNPLFVIRGKAESYLDALERGKYSEAEIRQASEAAVCPILNHATRALEIIQRFTEFARPFSPQSGTEKVLLSDVFKDVQDLVSSEFQNGNIKLTHNLTNGVMVKANRRHVEEILSNLVMNACHAIGANGGNVDVQAKSMGKKVQIEVADNGQGIPEENLNRVFEPFFTTKDAKGSGLGLYIAKQLVERNGGKIELKSKAGQGSVFSLRFQAVSK